MSKYARMSGNDIVEIIELDDAWYQNLVAVGNPKAQIFRIVVEENVPIYDQATQFVVESFIVEPTQVRRTWVVQNKSAEQIAEERRRVWTAYQFLNRFTANELEEVRERSIIDPICWRFLTLATAAQEIFNDDPMTVAGMEYLVAVNLLTPERRDEILEI